ncbi:hypothetical protein L210DRAFT_1058027 [Boletus edulis BED1]|uniref:Coilin n=1 Tax=Boletus edulis BED1 TaxID=1328754 RepID=A0AAD4G9K6_BOLED|nr:hypothetical protein L210DRAFT_1058027 [Boletus edulis BED1]
MRVKISANPPLPAVRAWFPLHGHTLSTSTISSFKSLLCTSLPDFRGISPSSLWLSIDGFELLDHSELTVVRDGDLVSVDVRKVPPENVTTREQTVAPLQSTSHATPAPLEPTAPRKRKRRASTPSSTSSESESDSEESTTSESESETSDSESESDSDDSTREVDAKERAPVTPSVRATPRVEQPSTFVAPGYGKPQTRARNLRRRLKRMHEDEGANASTGGPVSGANAVEAPDGNRDLSTLMSLSLRSKNKAKNFKSLMNRPLPAKIIFGDQERVQTARLVPPSSRASLPPNLFVTSVDVEAEKKQRRVESPDGDVTLDYGVEPEPASEVDIDRLERHANKEWASLEWPRRTKQLTVGTLVGYKALGIDAATCTPGHVLTVGRVVSCDQGGVVVRPFRAVSFSCSDETEAETEHPWEEIEGGDWRLL